MRTSLSKIIFGFSCLATAATALFTLLWFSIVIDHDGRGGLYTRSVVGPIWAASLLALAVIPSGMLFARSHRRCDLWSFGLSSISFLGVIGETLALFVVRLHGPW